MPTRLEPVRQPLRPDRRVCILSKVRRMSIPRHLHTPGAYRADIDGLRAIAIVLVLIYHAFPSAIPGGFIGVDVFFVISGYLISTVIWNDLEAGRFSYLDFYARRARRIFPALGAMLAVTLALGYFLLLPIEYEQLGKHTAGGSAFVQNFVLRAEAGYFDTASHTKPLLHLWSLAIEEQFYLLLPLLLVFMNARRVSPVVVIAGLAVLSFAYGLERAITEPERSFFNPLVRFWELLAGSLLAALEKKGSRSPLHRLNAEYGRNHRANALGLVGICLVLVSAGVFSESDEYPSWRALMPVAGAALMIAAGQHGWVNARLLSAKPMAGVGLISYSLYLWHWPLITFAHFLNQGDAPWSVRAAALLISVLFAYLTFKLVETPMRKAKPLSMATLGGVGLIAACGAAGVFVTSHGGLPGRDAEVTQVTQSIGSWEFPGRMEKLPLPTTSLARAMEPNAPKLTLFLGDSNIQHYYSRVDELIQQQRSKDRGAIFITGGGCLPLPQVKPKHGYRHCEGLAEAAVHLAKSNPKVDRVVIGAAWNGYFVDTLRIDANPESGVSEYRRSLESLHALVLDLEKHGREVFFVLNAPAGAALDPRNAIRRDLAAFPNMLHVRHGSIDRFEFERRHATLQSDLAEVASRAGASIIRPVDHLCAERCPALMANGLPLYKDSTHLNPLFVRHHATFIDPVMSTRRERND